MPVIQIIALASAAAQFLKDTIPQIRDAINEATSNGTISDADAQKARDAYNALRAAGPAEFQGPEYELSGR